MFENTSNDNLNNLDKHHRIDSNRKPASHLRGQLLGKKAIKHDDLLCPPTPPERVFRLLPVNISVDTTFSAQLTSRWFQIALTITFPPTPSSE